MPETPPREILSILGLEVVSDFAGRLNKHWLVESSGERMVLRRWAPQPLASIEYERRLVASLAGMGFPVATLGVPVEFEGTLWSVLPFLPGEPLPAGDPAEWRSRGRRLAEFHGATAQIEGLEQRPGWRRCEEILADHSLDRLLSENESRLPEEVRILRWHLDRARLRIEGLAIAPLPAIPNHGDFARWNLLFEDGRLTGLLDFELAHNDHRVEDFALAWRGKYDEVIEGYEEVSLLEPIERALVVPAWWASLIEMACGHLRQGNWDDGWIISKLLARSPFMGADAVDLP